ncbi:MAG: tetratricopeptide repeat protein [Methanobacterium sp. Maddingley MBC34]|nr:MAG: tetratricopeptide repeat protein [Methanobacterium sp. Maddingley MBC34]
MDIILIIGAMFLAYAGILMVYYNIRSKERQKRASKLMLNGVMSLRRGVHEKAIAYFKIAYDYSEGINDYHTMAESLYHIGLVYEDLNDLENAVYMFNEAAKIYGEIDDYEGMEKSTKASDSLKNSI